jgi:hypothetical protein
VIPHPLRSTQLDLLTAADLPRKDVMNKYFLCEDGGWNGQEDKQLLAPIEPTYSIA